MMTWHTQDGFAETAAELDDDHLLAAIEDGVELVKRIRDEDATLVKEPVYYMWRGSLPALTVYGMLHCMEWTFHRRYNDKNFWVFKRFAEAMKEDGGYEYWPVPWFRDEEVIASHRSALLAAYPDNYPADYWEDVPKASPVLWPFVEGSGRGAVAELRVARADFGQLRSGRLKVRTSARFRVTNLPKRGSK